ncbi:Fibrinogen- domains (FReDs) [Branchiostoma belcheri]|nr:Fibrinogen- domains (FReDs) [Branchiostoma belcheri]
MSRRRRGRSRPYCIVLTGSSTEVEQERDLTITGTTSLDRAFSQSPSAEHGSMPANLHGRYGGVKNSEWSLPLGQLLPRRPSLDERHTRTLDLGCLSGPPASDGPPQVTTPAAPTAPPQVTTPAAPTAPPQVTTPAAPIDPPVETDCDAYKAAGHTTSGVYTLGPPLSGVTVYCDMDTAGGGWTVIQRRIDGSVPFNRTWEEYKQGFGNKNGEYWLGNENIHLLTAQKGYKLQVDMMDWENQTRYAVYDVFRVAGESDGYRLTVSGYSGTAGDSMIGSHTLNGQKFSTVDRDNDVGLTHCSQHFGQGGWWFRHCGYSYLNGRYLGNCGISCPAAQGVVWVHWRGHRSLKSLNRPPGIFESYAAHQELIRPSTIELQQT